MFWIEDLLMYGISLMASATEKFQLQNFIKFHIFETKIYKCTLTHICDTFLGFSVI
jgi:hypothetical protein